MPLRDNRPNWSERPLSGYKKFYQPLTFEEVKRLLGIIIGSRLLTAITYVDSRGQIHVLKRASLNGILTSPIHNFKSSMLKAVEDAINSSNCARVEDLTFAGAIGAVQKETKTATTPFFWEANRRVALIDEYQPDEHGQLSQGFLKVMEWEPFSRQTAYEVLQKKNSHGQLGTYFRVKKGKIEILSKSVFIIATMDSPQFITRSKRGQALGDRCLIMRYEVTNEESDSILGFAEKESDVTIPIVTPKESEVHISKEESQRIFDIYKTLYGEIQNPRMFEDMVRAYAVLGYLDTNVCGLIAKAKKPLWRRPKENESVEKKSTVLESADEVEEDSTSDLQIVEMKGRDDAGVGVGQ
ncbi:MAG TPA: hypothetical protein VGS11_11865 [Candidatus Bathyarchaeia archaeon]|nr:hypothetical protein [Candidatus Bathyarchaeia archaeon]